MAAKAKGEPVKPRKRPKSAAGAAHPFGRSPLRTFDVLVALPVFVVYLTFTLILVAALALMAAEINRQDATRGEQAVAAALDSFRTALGDAVADEGTWNEAYLNVVVSLQPAWLDASWGSTARIGLNYDNVLVTDRWGAIVFGENGNGAITGNITDHFSGARAMNDELDRAIAVRGDDAVVSHFARNDDGVVALAAISIHRVTPGEMTVPREQRRILWLVRHLTPPVLQSIAERFQMPPLSFAATSDTEDSIVLADAEQAVAGALYWEPARPGDHALSRALVISAILLGAIGIAVAIGLAVLRRAIMARALLAHQSLQAAHHDKVTGLLNGAGLLDRLSELLSGLPSPQTVAMAYLGVDGYDAVRQEYGAETADELMRLSGRMIAREVGEEAVLARIGDGAFAIGAVGGEAVVIVGRLADAAIRLLSGPHNVNGNLVDAHVSVGLASGEGTDSLPQLQAAEAAMHAARSSGAATPVHLTPAEQAARNRQRAIVQNLRRAIARDEFELEYQPIFDVRAQTMIGVEALLRWRDPANGLTPAEFIPIAEAAGLIGDLGLLAFRRAARDILPLRGLMLALNVSTGEFKSGDFSEKLRGTLAAVQFPAARLQLEVTQSFLATRGAEAGIIIDGLREAGIQITLDDFVVGQSSADFLRHYTFDRVKLARSMVSGLDHDPTKLSLVEATANVARTAGVVVAATGVERNEEVLTLLRLGCSEFQGYLFAAPLSLQALTALVGAAIDQAAVKRAN